MTKVDQELHDLTARLSSQFAAMYSNWEPDLFERIASHSAATLWGKIKKQAGAEEILDAYLRLVADGIGAGWIRYCPSSRSNDGWSSFLEFLFLKIIPRDLSKADPESQLRTLVRLWNVLEKLESENACARLKALTECQRFKTLDTLDDFLFEILDAAFGIKTSTWRSPFRVTPLNTKEVDAAFLPGAMHLAAPGVVCIHDRIRPTDHVALFLHRTPQLVCHNACLGQFEADDTPVEVRFTSNGMRVNSQKIPISGLRAVHSHLICPSGAVLVSAVDSQRLWLVKAHEE